MLPQSDAMFDAWAGSRFATDWGTRSMAQGEATYDPMRLSSRIGLATLYGVGSSCGVSCGPTAGRVCEPYAK